MEIRPVQSPMMQSFSLNLNSDQGASAAASADISDLSALVKDMAVKGDAEQQQINQAVSNLSANPGDSVAALQVHYQSSEHSRKVMILTNITSHVKTTLDTVLKQQ